MGMHRYLRSATFLRNLQTLYLSVFNYASFLIMGIVFPIVGVLFVVIGFAAPQHSYPLTGTLIFMGKSFPCLIMSCVSLKVDVRFLKSIVLDFTFRPEVSLPNPTQPCKRILCWIHSHCKGLGSLC